MVAEQEVFSRDTHTIDCPVLVTGRLILRHPKETDAPAIAVLADNRHIAEMLGQMPHPYGQGHARSFIMMESLRRDGAVYLLTLLSTGEVIGCASLEARERGMELGYWVGEPFWSKGYATEAAQALIDLAFTETPVNVLHISCRVINTASRRVIHKCGFQYAGQGFMHSAVAGQVPIERYRLERDVWTSLRNWATSTHGMRK